MFTGLLRRVLLGNSGAPSIGELLGRGNLHFSNLLVGNGYEGALLVEDVPKAVNVSEQFTLDTGACSDLYIWQRRVSPSDGYQECSNEAKKYADCCYRPDFPASGYLRPPLSP